MKLTECDACIDAFILIQSRVRQIYPVQNELVNISATIKSFVQIIKNILVLQAGRHSRYQDLDQLSVLITRGGMLIASIERLYLTLNWLSLSQYIRDNEQAINRRRR
jgi:hypothetical protein